MTLQAYCPDCKKTVTAHTLLANSELKRALDTNADVELMHPTPNGDHRWLAAGAARDNLRNAIAKDLI